MKKSVLIAVLGAGALAASSNGQGFVYFTSYYANNGMAPFAYTYSFGTTSSSSIDTTFHADLYYAIGTVTDSVNNSLLSSVTALPAGTFTDAAVSVVYLGSPGAGTGFFGNPALKVTVPGYASGPISFEVVAFNGTSYASANSTIRGRSGAFTMNSIATGSNPVPDLGNNGSPLPVFYAGVVGVPEPTTLALAGLGGLAALVALRRKQA